MNIEELLKDRFVKSIRKSYHPCPLIGDKWFVFREGGAAQASKETPPDFQFLGVRKLAKATGIPAQRVAKFIARNLELAGLDVRVRIEEEWKIHLWRLPPGSGVRNEGLPTHAPATARPGCASEDSAGAGSDLAGSGPASENPAGPGPTSSTKESAGPGESGKR